ncbi:CAP domain-containing protein [Pedobacter psychrodurus]|uniref:CAP domain-containing protein n=1 Tax=Pedobacter psychrodurus TaxID=2530456 RepID=A0A4R0Q4D0_9SPHI|nr:CAP domain-containing protein [Pedobacter psychrodurus]TCD28538.1 CAP domain-containing protein [Pedobacter psychrodurus]
MSNCYIFKNRNIARTWLSNTYILVLTITIFSCKKEAKEDVKIDLRTELLVRLNQLREKGCTCGIDIMPPAPRVTWNTALEKTAVLHAEDMQSRNYFSHITPEGIPAIQRSRAQGYTGTDVGEVIAKNFTSADTVMAAWIASESHCKAMMDTAYNEVGAGKAGTYWVMDLGRKN